MVCFSAAVKENVYHRSYLELRTYECHFTTTRRMNTNKTPYILLDIKTVLRRTVNDYGRCTHRTRVTST